MKRNFQALGESDKDSFAWENILRDCTTDFDSELIDTMD